ncbi:hypothetical protein [Amycolatopsis sp. NPDC004625]|uniref:hypothetical protein n=1 Tax=Amycolatopsis sp. NPDC004625 TaxID=3154670 RepID=UPI0033BF2903
MIVIGDFSRVKRHSQPDPLLGPVRFIVPPEFPGERPGKDFDKGSFEDLRRHEHQRPVAGALVLAVEPRHPGLLEGTAQREIEPLPNNQPVRRRPALPPVTFDIHREHRAVDYQS